MKFRNEWKHEINALDMLILRQRLTAVMKPEPHGINGKYNVRSLYFDDLHDTALKEKINGVNMREKFRIRYYDGDTSFIRLEKKSKINGLCNKLLESISIDETQKILAGDISFMQTDDRPLVRELYLKMKNKGIRSKTIVDYTREAFTFPAGNVRVTMDYNIRTGMSCTDFLNPDCITVPVGSPNIILEIKWDEYLPDIIKCAVELESRRSSAFSKYAICRIYG
ncbi:MAG TPA: polyphosphate polymerase domain-containing protein [Oscillospiraceae bacterium]|nr:polyphosphate polymerase domain-containing protein [Oscillospiraceae bacterium]